MDEVAAGLSLIGIWRTGEEHPVEVWVGKPYEQDGDWACWVSVTWAGANTVPGMDRANTRPRLHHGADAMQALTLGLRFVGFSLGQFIECGGQLLYPEDREAFPMRAYFPEAWPEQGAA